MRETVVMPGQKPAAGRHGKEGAALPPIYTEWVEAAENLLEPLARLMQPGAAELPLVGNASNHGAEADRLESFARPLLLASHWLASDPAAGKLSREEIAGWFREGLLAGTNPRSDKYWGATANQHQHTVEMGAVVLSLEMARAWIWEPLGESGRAQVCRWLGSVRGGALHRNNHLFFGVLPLSFLLKEGFGGKADGLCVRRWLDILEGMALGGGWFIDGMNESVDHYNAYAFHYYGLWWGELYGSLDPDRARRWRGWAGEFLEDYAHFFAATGEPVPFGRSMTYRFAASAPFALAEKLGASPIAPGVARRLCTANLRFFLERPIRQSQGALSLGWTDEFPPMAEAYSCAGSPYWAAKGFAPLLIPPAAPFWNEPEMPLPCEAGDFSRPLREIGMVIRGDGGAVEMLNAATSISGGNTAFGAYKWGKLSYRTGPGFEIQRKDGLYPIDAALTAEAADGTIYGRQATHPLEIEEDHIGCVYSLGNRFTAFNAQIETWIWWRGGWQFHWHRCRCHQRARLQLGAYSLAAKEEAMLGEEGGFPFVRANNGSEAVALQSLAGFTSAGRRLTRGTAGTRTHILAANSLVLFLQTDWLEEECGLAAFSWIGPAGGVKPEPWKVTGSSAGHLSLAGAGGEKWTIEHEALPMLGF